MFFEVQSLIFIFLNTFRDKTQCILHCKKNEDKCSGVHFDEETKTCKAGIVNPELLTQTGDDLVPLTVVGSLVDDAFTGEECKETNQRRILTKEIEKEIEKFFALSN